MNHSKYQKKLLANIDCTNRMMEEKKGIDHRYRKGDTRDCFIFGSWFYSKKSAESAMEVGADLIVMV